MAEFLLKLSEPDANDDIKTSWHPGDILNIKSDGFVWGTEEKEPIFNVLKIPGISVGSCLFLLGSWTQNQGEVYRMSLWKWDFDNKVFVRKQDGLTKTSEDLR